MTKLEILCVIIGFIMFIGCSNSSPLGNNPIILKHWLIRIIVTRFFATLMILLPLYFRIWKNL